LGRQPEGDRILPAEWGGGRRPRFNCYPLRNLVIAVGCSGHIIPCIGLAL